MAEIQNTTNAGEDVQKQDLSFITGGMQNGTATLEESLEDSYKAKYSLTMWSIIILLDIYPNELKTYIHTKNLHMNIYRIFIHNCQNLEATKIFVNRWVE